jgi:tetratricopeptide (TPR) repeat protein
MLKCRSGLPVILLVLVPFGTVCLAQEQPAAEQPGQAPVTRSPADFTIPELMSAADRARQAGRFTDAINLLNVVVQRTQDQTNIDVLRMLGDIAWDMGNAEEARKQWTLVKNVQPSDFGANWGLGRIWLRSGVPRQALGYFETAKTVIPSDKPELQPQVLLGLAQAYAGSTYPRKAVETVQQVLELDPQNLDAWYMLASLRAQAAVTLDDFNEALSDASQLVAIAENDVKIHGLTPERLQRLAKAYELKRAVLTGCGRVFFEPNPDGRLSDRLLPGMERTAARVFSILVDTWMRQADLERTMEHFRILQVAAKAVEYDGGTDPETLLKLGSLQAATGQLADAIETLRRVLVLDPANVAARQQLDALQQQTPAATGPTP